MEIQSRIISIVTRMGFASMRITSDTQFHSDLGMDSLDMAELLATVEADFKLRIKQKDANQITTVRQLSELILNKLIDKEGANQ